LGGLFIAAGRKIEAREAYAQATVVAPSMGEGWYNLGICLRDEGDFEAALIALRASVAREPGYSKSYDALATLLYQMGLGQESARVYRDWAAREPRNPKALHMAAASSQENVPSRAADDYVRELFDSSAKSFDADLEKLGYKAPELVAAALKRQAGHSLATVLDAGCGTGLCGPLLAETTALLVGVDLSAEMIERARARGGYDELHVEELTRFLRAYKTGYFDAIVSADTLVYFGALEEPLVAAFDALDPGGVLVFSVESLGTESDAAYRLESHGRYAHSERYVRNALDAAGFSLASLEHAALREERGQPVNGMIVVARKGQ
jgi:predicted TPR repeat methyltransferase